MDSYIDVYILVVGKKWIVKYGNNTDSHITTCMLSVSYFPTTSLKASHILITLYNIKKF